MKKKKKIVQNWLVWFERRPLERFFFSKISIVALELWGRFVVGEIGGGIGQLHLMGGRMMRLKGRTQNRMIGQTVVGQWAQTLDAGIESGQHRQLTGSRNCESVKSFVWMHENADGNSPCWIWVYESAQFLLLASFGLVTGNFNMVFKLL